MDLSVREARLNVDAKRGSKACVIIRVTWETFTIETEGVKQHRKQSIIDATVISVLPARLRRGRRNRALIREQSWGV